MITNSAPAGTAIATAAPATIRKAPKRRRRTSRLLTPYLLLAPFLALFVAFMIAPLVYAFWLSLQVKQRVGGSRFGGFENYADVLADPLFHEGLLRVGVYGLIQVPVTVGLALFLALALDSGRVRGKTLFQLGFFIPFAIPGVVAALLWGYLYGREFGVFTQMADAASIPAPNLLGTDLVVPSIANIAVWAGSGATMIILYSALRSIPPELYEAARIDGANDWSVIWHIKLPLLRSTLLFSAVLAIIVALQLFTEPSILASQARGVIKQSFTPNLYAYNLVGTNQQYNYAAALSFITAITIVLVTAIVLVVSRRKGSNA
ncbi:carbohydrate ABC transporter permease [Pseudarthrobacter scleromae]|uniref:carbohydrate ABC transporter permease n=1 Tax=Pseudarthrobacter scleromae TaxID=158897 RepID=UPI003D0613DA